MDAPKYNKLKCVPIHENLDKFVINGVTFYTLPNPRPDDTIEMRLIVNTGSLMENEDERGLAHFIEHLGFKGTKSFGRYELVKMLESLGISYGPDLNASTHLLETTYKLSIRVDPELTEFRVAANILCEWAFHMSLSDEDILEERNVIMSEYIAKQGLGARLLAKYWKCVFDNDIGDKSSLVARRMPIGVPEVFMNAYPDRIRSFYRRWYHPNNMAILIVGAIRNRQEDVKRIVTECFSVVPRPPLTCNGLSNTHSCQEEEEECDLPLFRRVKALVTDHLELPIHHSQDVSICMSDRELTTAQLSFEAFSPVHPSCTIDFVKDNVLHRLMASLVDKRLNEIIKRRSVLPEDVVNLPSGECPFLSVGLSIREFVRGLRCVALTGILNMNAGLQGEGEERKYDEQSLASGDLIDASGALVVDKPKPNNHSDWNTVVSCALRSLMIETRRIREWGVHADELRAAKAKWAQLFVDQRDRNTTVSGSVMADLTAYVLNGGESVFASPSYEAELCLQVMEKITVEDMNVFLSSSLDMDVCEEKSGFYASSSSTPSDASRGKFRVLSGQFPGASAPRSLDGPTVLSDDEALYKALVEARADIAAFENLQQWPVPDHIQEEALVHAARVALGLIPSSSNKSEDLDGTMSEKESRLNFDRDDSAVQLCACCNRSVSFLPKQVLSDMTSGKKIHKKKGDALKLSSAVATGDQQAEAVEVEVAEEMKLDLNRTSKTHHGDECSELNMDRKSNDVVVNELPSISSYEFRLPNGITVCAKWMPEDSPGKVSFQGFALGGSTELSESQDTMMSFLDSIASHSSLQVTTPVGRLRKQVDKIEEVIILHAKDIAEIQSVAKVGVNTQRHFNHRGIGGSGPVEKFELLLSLLTLKLTSQCIDEKAFNDLVKQQKSYLLFSNNSPEQAFLERARILSCGDIPISRPLTLEVLSSCTLDMTRQLYARAFMADPTEFTFVFIGDLPPLQEVQRLFAMYLGSLRPMAQQDVARLGGKWGEVMSSPLTDSGSSAGCSDMRSGDDDGDVTTMETKQDGRMQSINERDTFTTRSFPFTRLGMSFEILQPVQETVCLRKAENASTMLIFRAVMRHGEDFAAEQADLRDTVALDVACRHLQSALLDELRIRLGKVYSVSVDFSRGSLSHVALISVSLHCDPAHLSQIRFSIEQQLDILQKEGANPAALPGIVETMCTNHLKALKSPSHWMFWILDSYKSHAVYDWLTSHGKLTSHEVCSSQWVEKCVQMRSHGKIDVIRNVVGDENILRGIYNQHFNLSRSVHMHLCPQSDDESLVSDR